MRAATTVLSSLAASGLPKSSAQQTQQIVALNTTETWLRPVRRVRFRTSLCATGQARVYMRDVTWTAHN